MLASELFLRWLLAFGLTQLIEVPIYLRGLPPGASGRRIGVAFGASALTHPFVAFVIPWLWSKVLTPVVFIPGHTKLDAGFLLNAALFAMTAEGFAIAAEALYMSRFCAKRPLRLALTANLASSIVGALLTWQTGWP